MCLFVASKNGAVVAVDFTTRGVRYSALGKPSSEELFGFGLFEMDNDIWVVTRDGEYRRLLLVDAEETTARVWAESAANSKGVTIRGEEAGLTVKTTDMSELVVGVRIEVKMAASHVAYSLNGRRIGLSYLPVSELSIAIPEEEIRPGASHVINIATPDPANFRIGNIFVHCVPAKRYAECKDRCVYGDWLTEATDLFQCPSGIATKNAKLAVLGKVASVFRGSEVSEGAVKELFALLYTDLEISILVRQMLAKLKGDRANLVVQWAEAIAGAIEQKVPSAVIPALWRDYALLPPELRRPMESKIWEKVSAGELELDGSALASVFV
jgi:hypothetical protein